MSLDIGGKLKEERKKQGMSIATLARKSDVSNGMISQIERNFVVPSSIVLWRLSQSLGKSISYFFGEDDPIDSVVLTKKGNHEKLLRGYSSNDGYFELLSPKDGRAIELLKITIKPKDYTGRELITHRGEECGYVISGKLLVKMPNRDYTVETGDSIHFISSIPHLYANIWDEDCVSIWTQEPYTW